MSTALRSISPSKALWLCFLLGSVVACGPKCLRGHVEQQIVAGHYEDQGFLLNVGDINIWMPNNVWIPAHPADVFVCDQYEVEKS